MYNIKQHDDDMNYVFIFQFNSDIAGARHVRYVWK